MNKLHEQITCKTPEHQLAVANNILRCDRQSTLTGLTHYLKWMYYSDFYANSKELPRKERARCIKAARKILRSPIGNHIFALYIKQGYLP